MLKAILRPVARWAVRFKPVRESLIRYYDARSANVGWSREHPVDVHYGINTSSAIPGYVLRGASRASTGYAASQPSIIRQSLVLVAEPERTVFLDLGCGKGRVLVVASEFPFREVIGIELSEVLAATAAANTAIVRRTYPERCPIRVAAGDAVEYPLPNAPLAIFLFNPFGAALIARLLARIEDALRSREHPITIVYYNPICGALFDASSSLVRTHAVCVPYDESEMGFGSDVSDTVAIWQDRRHSAGQPSAEAGRPIIVREDGLRAELGLVGQVPGLRL